MRYRLLACMLLAQSIGQAALADIAFSGDVPHFAEQAESAGISHQYRGPFEYFVGGGAASFDCNGDRMPDLFLAGGTGPARLYINRSKTGGELQFMETSLLPDGLTKVIGAYPINLDNDAYTDLVVLRLGQNILLKGAADCQFELANDSFEFDGGDAWTTGFSAIWEGGAAFPTLAFGNYIDRDAPGSPWGTCEDNRLVRAGGDTPEFNDNIALSPGHCSLSMLMTDWQNNGEFDLRVTNDRQYYRGGKEQLWSLNDGGEPREYSARDGWRKLVIWGMGIAEADINGDGKPEYALSSMGDTMLQTLDDETGQNQPVYRDIAFERGSTAHRPYQGDDQKPSTGWHTQFADLNNDARLDLFIAKGNVERMPDFAAIDPDNLLLGTADGRFSEQGGRAGIDLPRRGRGAVVEDFNADGLLDLLVVNREEPVSLFRNQGAQTDWGHRPMGNFLAIELQNGSVNPDGIGAQISVKTGNLTQIQTVRIGGGHASGQLGFTHFGLGVAERAEVRIKWPEQGWGQPHRLFANNFVVIDRESATTNYWYPR